MLGRMIIPAALNKTRNGSVMERRNARHPSVEDADAAEKKVKPDRRTSRRFPIVLPGEVSTRKTSMHGTTVNVSSGGLLIYCSEGTLKVGEHVKVRLTSWPGARHDSNLALVVEGVIVRSWAGYLAVRKKRYEFTQG